ncbi:MAG: glycosyltransferase family 25 protein [Bacteroidia bacterium]
MDIYITNLKWSKERRLHMEKQLKGTKLTYQFFDCVVGADLTDAEIAEKCDIENINKLNDNAGVEWFNRGIIGCTLTWQNMLRDMIAKDLDYMMLLEDDTIIPDNLFEILEFTQSQIRQGDMLLLYWKAWEPLQLTEPVISTPFGFNYYIAENYKVLTGGNAWIMTRQVAERMLALNIPIHTTPDNYKYFFDHKAIDRLICAYPHVVKAANFKSTMHKGRFVFLRKVIDRYKIFPFYQYLNYQRNKNLNKAQEVVFIK